MARGADQSGPSDTPSDGSLDTTEIQGGHVTRTEPRLAPGTDPEPGTRVGEYVIERKVGRGGMGSVFAAVHPVIGKRAAIKVIAWDLCRDASFVARFVSEARAVNKIGHPNIVEAFSIGQLEDGRACYAMEWLDGVSLRQRLREERMGLGEAAGILDQIADALQAVHDAGIIHRDLTPQNLFLVDRRGRLAVKLLDFGIAKDTGLETGGLRTHSGMVLGTPTYVSPEQATGEPVDHRTDIYGLGVIAYEMLAGKPPFADQPTTAVLSRKMVEPPTPLGSLRPDLPPELATLVDAMLAIDPAARPSVAAFRAALARTSAAPRRRGLVGRRSAALIAGGAVGLAGYFALRGIAAEDGDPQAVPVATAEPARTEPVTAPVADAGLPGAAPGPEGAVDVTLDVDQARVELDGALVGSGVRRLRVPVAAAGVHTLVVTAPGHQPVERRIEIAAGAVASVSIELERVAPPPTGRRKAGEKPKKRPRQETPSGKEAAAGDNPDYLLPPRKLPD